MPSNRLPVGEYQRLRGARSAVKWGAEMSKTQTHARKNTKRATAKPNVFASNEPSFTHGGPGESSMVSDSSELSVYTQECPSKVYTFRLSADEAATFDAALRLMRVSVSDACRAGMFDWVQGATDHLGELAAKEQVEKRWARECSDPRGAAAWAKCRDGIGRVVKSHG